MLTVIKDTLKKQTLCPSCGVSWQVIEDCLHDGLGSDNYSLAQCLMSNCEVCRERFRKC